MLGHVTIPAVHTKFACCRFGGIPWRCCWRCCLCQSRAAQKNKSLTARGPLFLLAKFQRCFVCCEHCGSKNQNQKRPIMRVCCFDACCPANLGTVRFLFGSVRFCLWFVSGFLAVLKTGSVNRFPVRFSTFLKDIGLFWGQSTQEVSRGPQKSHVVARQP